MFEDNIGVFRSSQWTSCMCYEVKKLTSLFQARPLVTASEDSLLKILRLLIDEIQLDLIEIYSDISLFGYKMLVKDAFDQNKIFEVMSIPQTAENLAAIFILHTKTYDAILKQSYVQRNI